MDAPASLGNLYQSLVTLRMKVFPDVQRERTSCVSVCSCCMSLKESMTHPDTNIQEMYMTSFFMLCFRHSHRTNISWPFCTDKGAGTVKQVTELDHSYPKWFPALQAILSNNSLVVPLKFNLHWIKHLSIACSKNWNSGLVDVYHLSIRPSVSYMVCFKQY